MPGRFPGKIGSFAGRLWSSRLGLELDEALRKLAQGMAILQKTPGDPSTVQAGVTADAGEGPAPALDDHVHAVETATPTNATAAAAAEGTGSALMRADATIRQGIVTTKGDLLGYSTVPARVPVGSDGQALIADSTAAQGVSWGTGTDAAGAAILAWML